MLRGMRWMRRVNMLVCSVKAALVHWVNISARCCCSIDNAVDVKNASKIVFSSMVGVK